MIAHHSMQIADGTEGSVSRLPITAYYLSIRISLHIRRVIRRGWPISRKSSRDYSWIAFCQRTTQGMIWKTSLIDLIPSFGVAIVSAPPVYRQLLTISELSTRHVQIACRMACRAKE